MAKPKFIADADFNENLTRGLRRNEASIDFLTASEGGTRGIPDRKVLELAAAVGRVVVSHDRNTDDRRVLPVCGGGTFKPGSDHRRAGT
jgi:predicted nuclease of predicted toxin-antitoxin system